MVKFDTNRDHIFLSDKMFVCSAWTEKSKDPDQTMYEIIVV